MPSATNVALSPPLVPDQGLFLWIPFGEQFPDWPSPQGRAPDFLC